MALVHYYDEYSRLRKVAMYRPSFEEISQTDPSEVMYVRRPNPERVIKEFDNIVQAFGDLGVEVVVLEPDQSMSLTSNMIYLRDVALVFRNDLVLANMRHDVRRQEPEKFRQLLLSKDAGYDPHFKLLETRPSMEGADIFVLDTRSLCAYTGSRTDSRVVDDLTRQYETVRVEAVSANINGIPQHLLGGVHIIDRNLATRRTQYCNSAIADLQFIDFDEDDEIASGFALNIVTIAPRHVLMPANRPKVRRRLESYGIRCAEVEIDEIHKMGGGLACLVLPLVREAYAH